MDFVFGTVWVLYMTVVHILAILGAIVGYIFWEQGRY